MIDLHTHTDESDGSLSPKQLIEAASETGLRTLAITDHDTFRGYEKAAALPRSPHLRLIRGIELNTRRGRASVHLLAYFPNREPAPEFTAWLSGIVEARRDRNRRLIARLQTLGVDIELPEVEALGRSMTGRPHFARVLVSKGYAASRDEAFSKLIGENGRAFVERDAPSFAEAVRRVGEGGGLASLAHPVRLGRRDHTSEERFIAKLRDTGLPAIEAYHSDHTEADIERYLSIARRYGFSVTGGSDFHGSYKPNVKLGYAANGTIPIPASAVEALAAV